jgi:hypothetical protein
MTTRTVYAKTTLPLHQATPSFSSYGLRHGGPIALDPFLNLDDFRMSQPTFPPHPHAGFSAVTYLFEDSAGSFINRDSLGDRSRIEPGALHWTQAARGMMHEEIPEKPGTDCHGLQMFVNLRREHKHAAPRAFHLTADRVPEFQAGDGARVRVLAGSIAGVASPLHELLTPVALCEVHLKPQARLDIPTPAKTTAFALVVAGSGMAGDADGATLAAHDAVGFANDGSLLRLVSGPRGLQVLVGFGEPIGEPVVFGGPFAMTTREDLRDAEARFRAGEMGRLERSF